MKLHMTAPTGTAHAPNTTAATASPCRPSVGARRRPCRPSVIA